MRKKIIIATLISLCLGSAFVGLTACKNNDSKHEHTYATEWTKTDTEHYYAATCEHTNEKKNSGLHDTNGTDGACSVCGYKAATVTPPAHTHTPGNWINTDSEQHYKLCAATDCDNPTEKLEAAAHDTNGTDGACSVCGYKPAPVTPPAHTHTPGNWINTDSEQHYKMCTATDCDNPTEKLEAAAHDTNGTDGACSVCGYKPAPVTPPEHATHDYGNWTVTTENTPTRVLPGKAVGTCTYTDCNGTDEIELPPLANIADYTLTDNTADCENGGTATYTYTDGNNTVIFTAATVAKGHSYGEVEIVNGVPKQTCGTCHTELPAQSSATLNGSGSVKFYAGGNLGEFTVTANSGPIGYYTYTYEGETEITVDYNYYSLRDGEVSDIITLGGNRTKLTVYLETRATCTMKITSASAEAFIGEISSEFSDKDPSYVTPTLSLGVTTVSTTYGGIAYEFTAPVTGSYTLFCENAVAVILNNNDTLTLPYTFNLSKDETISFIMCCDDEAAEYDVKVDLNMQGSGTYSDPYIITEDMLAVNIGTTLTNGETKYYKLALTGKYLLHCLPIENEGSHPNFVSDDYTAETFTQTKIVGEETITVTGWQVQRIECGENGFIFALTCSGSNATDNVHLYVNTVYGTENNPASWVYGYLFYDYQMYGNPGTVYVEFLSPVTGRVDISALNAKNIKLNGEVVSVDGSTFEIFVEEGKIYNFSYSRKMNADGATAGFYIIETKDYVTTVEKNSKGKTYVNNWNVVLWFNYSEGDEHNPIKLNEGGNIEIAETYNTYAVVEKSGYYTFTLSNGVTAVLNGETNIVSGTQYKLVADDEIVFGNTGAKTSVSVAFEASTGDATNPLLVKELENNHFTVDVNASYYVKADGASDIVLTFGGVTVTHNGSLVSSGAKLNLADGDVIVIVNNGSANATVSYVTTAVVGSVNNPKPITVGNAETVTDETYLTVTITGNGNYNVTISSPVSEMKLVHAKASGMTITPSEESYALYGVMVEYNGLYYAFDKDGILCEVKTYSGSSTATALVVGTAMNGNAFVATKENIPLVLSAGTHTLRILKNGGTTLLLEDMALGCTITVVDEIIKAPTYYTVSFVTNKSGLSVDAQSVKDGETATNETISCDGFNFIGWYTDASLTTAFDFKKAIYKDTTLYAKWEEIVTPPTPSTEGTEDAPFTLTNGENSGMTTADDDDDSVGACMKYYTYTATADCVITVSDMSAGGVLVLSKISFDDARECENIIEAGYDDEPLTVNLTAGEMLYIMAGVTASVGGNYSFNVVIQVAIFGTEDAPFTLTNGENSGMTTADDDDDSVGACMKYYTYTATADCVITVSDMSAGGVLVLSKISFDDARECENIIEAGYDDEPLTVNLTAGEMLYIMAGVTASVGGNYSFNVSIS